MPHTAGHKTGTDMDTCIENCLDCHSICLQTVVHCLGKGGRHAEPRHIGLLLDCADICATSANFMLRDSDLHGRTCAVCAEVCERCADDCERFADDADMQACAENVPPLRRVLPANGADSGMKTSASPQDCG